MKVTISVGGRFHAFNLAHELEKRGALERLITSYPAFITERYGVPRTKVRSIIAKELLQRGWNGLPRSVRASANPQFFVHTLYDTCASRYVGVSDIFVGWSSFSLRSLRNAKEHGALGIVERGSSHIEYQRDIIREEYALHGLALTPADLPHPKIVDMELREYAEADRISIPSHFVKRTLLAKGIPEAKLIHVPYGVDLAQFRGVPKTDGVFRVVFVGGMCLRKGVHYLLQAFAELKLPNAELLLVGAMNDEMEPFFKRYAGTFKYIGSVPQAELYRYYSQGSVFALMSIEEGLAMVVPQAMACGLPVIATTNTGAEDIVRDGKDGFIIPIRDTEMLKEKLVYLYDHSDVRGAMGRSAQERVSSGFTWDDYGNRIIAEYERVLVEKRKNI
jgi:glycosyltransferase involved in cell wall biosynthesis